MSYAVGSLVRARGREWVVLPESTDDMLRLRPLGGTNDEIAGVLTALEPVEPASFAPPNPADLGDARSCRLLRDAVRLGFRSSAGPFRSFGQIAVEPRPYQLVPLLMALRLDPVRLLLADDVGVGKTVEALLIARELLDRGDVERLTVLCPPHLAEQWQAELATKFHIDAELVLASTASRLERACGLGQSIFELYPITVVSIDFIKSDRRREEFLRACPELVIVDEAHTCAGGGPARGARHQRHDLVASIASDLERHLILVTATPHSGDEQAFRSLLALLDPSFAGLPEDLSGPGNEAVRRRLARHFVQRRRGDIRHYLQADTPFPERFEAEETYSLSPAYQRLFARALAYARESVQDEAGGKHRQRVRWWSALALLRSHGSSPAAAAETLRNRAAPAETDTLEEANEVGARTVLDQEDIESTEGVDVAPGADPALESDSGAGAHRAPLLAMAREAEALMGAPDYKLTKATELIRSLVEDGFRPIVFCRFIPTAEYVAAALRGALKGVEVAAVTGTLPPAEREARVLRLAEREHRVLVCTDCLSEGINLQEHFDTVFHYDLSWNPTRHEQREGRVDRYGQARPEVRVVTYWGIDNQIDGIVLDVLLRKHKAIRSSLGISVPVPASTNQVVEAIFEGLLLREQSAGNVSNYLPGFDELFKPQRERFFQEWEHASDRERRSRTMFAQEAIRVDEVKRELDAVQAAIGSGVEVAGFLESAVRAAGGAVSKNGVYRFDFGETPGGLRDLLGLPPDRLRLKAGFEPALPDGVLYLSRTHPLVEGVASWVMNAALDDIVDSPARRAGVIRTAAVSRRTTLLLARFRYHIVTSQRTTTGIERTLLAEECGLLGFRGAPGSVSAEDWLTSQEAEALLAASPAGNVAREQSREFLGEVIEELAGASGTGPGDRPLQAKLGLTARVRADDLLEAHRRVRQATRAAGDPRTQIQVRPNLPVDVLGVYVYLPAPGR